MPGTKRVLKKYLLNESTETLGLERPEFPSALLETNYMTLDFTSVNLRFYCYKTAIIKMKDYLGSFND